jgi:hypothetical protein
MSTPIADSYWVVDRLLLAGEYPGALDDACAGRKLDGFLDAGIRVFVDLTEAVDGLKPYQHILEEQARARGVRVEHVRAPIKDLGVPTAKSLRTLLSRIAANVHAGVPSYVHCWGGIGRTGTVVGCWMVEREGLSGEAALQRIVDLRKNTPDGFKRSPETPEQRDMVLGWTDTLKSFRDGPQ